MRIELIEQRGRLIAEIIADTIVINDIQDAIDLMAECQYSGANSIVMQEQCISSSFFNLKSALAGDILQKFSNYRVRLAIIGNFAKYSSPSLKAFIPESNRHGQILFIDTRDKAIDALAG